MRAGVHERHPRLYFGPYTWPNVGPNIGSILDQTLGSILDNTLQKTPQERHLAHLAARACAQRSSQMSVSTSKCNLQVHALTGAWENLSHLAQALTRHSPPLLRDQPLGCVLKAEIEAQ